MYEKLLELDNLRLNFNQSGMLALNITLGFIMFGVALGIKVENFKKLFLSPKPLLIGFLSQFLMLPLMTFLLILAFNNYITAGVAMGMILVAACPGGNISNFISSVAKGNVELSISLTAIATAAALLLTPLNFALWGELYIRFQEFKSGGELLQPLRIDPLEMFKTVFILLGIPVILGMSFSWKFPNITKKIIKPIQKISVILFMVLVVMAFIKNFHYFELYIKYIMIVVLLHNAVALFTGYSFASIFKLGQLNRRTITIETGIQNSGLGLVLLLNENIFPPGLPIGGMLFIAGWWGIWHMISGLGIAAFWNFRPIKSK